MSKWSPYQDEYKHARVSVTLHRYIQVLNNVQLPNMVSMHDTTSAQPPKTLQIDKAFIQDQDFG